jgi:UDP-N-acetyl-D-mannosaminuronate dehydrogenase
LDIREKIQNRSAKIGVVGLGYVGLPLAVLQAKTGYHVFGVDEVAAKVEMVNQANNYILDVDDAELREVVDQKLLEATTDFSVLQQCDIILICVPTPLTRNKEPDISAIVKVLGHLAHQYAGGAGKYDLPRNHGRSHFACAHFERFNGWQRPVCSVFARTG